MSTRSLDPSRMRRALAALDKRIDAPTRLVIGGGAAMILAYDHPLATQDVDAFTAKGGLSIAELDVAAKQVAAELGIEPDWLNSHFYSYTPVLPDDYATRLRNVFRGEHVCVDALGPEDLLIMKCFAGRDKDLPHARRLMKYVCDIDLIDRHLSSLVERGHHRAEAAAEYFDDLRDECDR